MSEDAVQGESATALDPDEEKRVVEEESLNAATTHEVIRRQGRKELERTAAALAWSGIAAGLSMGLSLVAQAVISAAMPDSPHRAIVTSFGYSAGFLAVILGSQQLFTENTLTPIVPFMTERTPAMFGKVLKLWGVVLLANLVGGLLFSEAIAHAQFLAPAARDAADAIARESLEPSSRDLFIRAIGSGWMIALMVWMLPAAGGATPFVVVVMTWLVSAAGLPHVVVGSIELFYLAARDLTSLPAGVIHYLLPVLAGNLLGGTTLVAALNHAQVATDSRAATK
ncbi:MAG: formate/nitrite transporter family protein [Polyangia bacterium]